MGMTQARAWLWIWVTAVAGLLPVAAHAFIDVSPPATTHTVNWAGGDVVRTVDYCVISVTGNQQSGTNITPYEVTITSSTAALTLTGPGTALPVQATWTNIYNGAVQTLVHGAPSVRNNTGAIDPCPLGNNGRATLTVLATDLYTRPPGTYTATFTYRVRNAAIGKKRDTATITLSIVIPTVLHLSGLNTIALGMWDGLNPMVGSDALCVFINSGVLYTVTASGSGTGGAFEVTNGLVPIAYTATWDDGGGAMALTPAVSVTNRANANIVSIDCSGGAANNATLAVNVPVANLQAVLGTGNFIGTITLTVQAQ